ncbi:MAG TPA: DNA polymerase III subunit delta' C-terminal domain-containing protein [Candidatus Dormibacteraeota bacterium]|nr:DNA polymerase III subunit delta' C-terminal domain-containing protein [Candidatus Dormibacteraeota bacterium]
MGFDQFAGNPRIVTALRRMLERERVPHAMLFTGHRGVGRYTLAVLFAQAANCERLQDDSCGECDTCRRIGRLADPEPLVEQGLAERGENPDSGMIERVPLILETHPDVWALVPDPVRRNRPAARPVIRMGQLRAAQRAAYFVPVARRRVFILDSAETMRWDYANIFLKILEEPPETATFILLAPRPEDMLPTIRSRAVTFRFAPLPTAEVEEFLEKRSSLEPGERKLAAALSEGSPGEALRIDLKESVRLREEVVQLLALSFENRSWSEVLALCNQLTKSGAARFENVLELLYSVLTDLLYIRCGFKGRFPHYSDPQGRLEGLSRRVTLGQVRTMMESLDRLSAGLRRNINRELSLEAALVGWANAEKRVQPDRRSAPRQ